MYGHNSLRNYTYVLSRPETKKAWVIDPWDGEAIVQWAQEHRVTLSGILNTHQHPDHTRGNAYLLARGVVQLQGFEELPPAAGASMQTWRTPGHTSEHVVFWLRDGDQEHLFAGDTIFQAGVGNCKNGGSPDELFHTLVDLSGRLNPDTWVHPGHDYLERNLGFALHVEPTNQAAGLLLDEVRSSGATFERPAHQWRTELLVNPFLRLSQRSLLPQTGPLASTRSSDQMVFKTLRQMRDNW